MESYPTIIFFPAHRYVCAGKRSTEYIIDLHQCCLLLRFFCFVCLLFGIPRLYLAFRPDPKRHLFCKQISVTHLESHVTFAQ